MKTKYILLGTGLLFLFRTSFPAFSQSNNARVFMAGKGLSENFKTVFQLSDSTILIGGSSKNLSWLPAGTLVTELQNASAINSVDTGRAFLLQVTQDLNFIIQAVVFPPNTVADVSRIRTNTLPGTPTGDLYISGRRTTAVTSEDGYYIARLNSNFLNAVPDSCSWIFNAVCREKDNDHEKLQPWDVGGDGKVIAGYGEVYNFNWAEMIRLNARGEREVVPNWRVHWPVTGPEYYNPASTFTGGPLKFSAIVLKAGRKGSLRSYTNADHSLLQEDENNNPGRKGKYPDDYYYAGPCRTDSNYCAGGPGYTGYKVAKPTQRLGGIVIDRRNGHFYFGYSTQTLLPNGLPDFEPAVVAMAGDGSLKWWARLYKEDNTNSTPDQYVDGMDLDYAHDRVVIAARCHGNNVVNLWKGNSLVNNPTAKGFQNSFSGTSGNIHISWLAKYGLDNGKIYNATFVAELGESSTNNFGSNYSNPLYANWPDLNSGWPNLTTTRIQGLTVATNGEVCILGLGRRTFTTANAFQRMPNPRSPAKGTWNNFVRVYSADLSNVLYSSLLTGAWDTTSGAGGDNTTLTGVYPINKNILVTGSIRKSGNRIPRSEPVSWADSTLNGPKAVFAQLPLAELPAVTRVSKPEKSKSGIVFFPNPTQGKVRWIAGDQTRTTETNGLWEIFNVLGEKVRSSKPESDPDHLDLSGLPAGLYRITDGKGGSGSVLFQPSL